MRLRGVFFHYIIHMVKHCEMPACHSIRKVLNADGEAMRLFLKQKSK